MWVKNRITTTAGGSKLSQCRRYFEYFSFQKYQEAIQESENLKVTLTLILPTNVEEIHFKKFILSQIFWVMIQYIEKKNIPLKQPPIDVIEAKKSYWIFQDIINQANLSDTQLFSKLQIMDGDLGASLNLDSLRSQRKPSFYLENSLGMFSLLGDLGGWITLQALGLSSDQPLTKNDFMFILTNIKKIHEASLICCLLLMMGITRQFLTNEKLKISVKSIQHTICHSSKTSVLNYLPIIEHLVQLVGSRDINFKSLFKAPPLNDSTHHKIPTTNSLQRIKVLHYHSNKVFLFSQNSYVVLLKYLNTVNLSLAEKPYSFLTSKAGKIN
ncbi:hypothetical protein VP01_2288g1 [Puccinia sorghi]|uniref:Uncharacterized protein n=1 Tax=Puccinia sorghi TaxID=27349 RepID=A0A0L6V9X4_9BASI|nr:hypothetical protein VP01_2288g1 [Puccinia sorghi]